MGNRNYVRGRSMEYKVMRTLELIGFTCTRSASSQGLWDVVCARGDEIRFVQSKLTSTGDFSEDENCTLLRELPLPACAKKEIWLYAAGEGLVEVRDLRKPKPDARTAEGKAHRERAREAAHHIRQVERNARQLKKAA
jgi:hypothetical protein